MIGDNCPAWMVITNPKYSPFTTFYKTEESVEQRRARRQTKGMAYQKAYREAHREERRAYDMKRMAARRKSA